MTTILFSEYIANAAKEDSLFITLSTETELSMFAVKPLRVEIRTKFSSMSPIVTFEFIDGNGDFVNHNKPSPDTVFRLSIGRDIYKTLELELRYTKIVMLNGRAGTAENIHFKMFFVHKEWDAMFNRYPNRGWSNQSYSDIAKSIAAEIGYGSIDIPGTAAAFDTVIQPFWTNAKMIRYMKGRASSSAGGAMEFGARIGGGFFFKSIGDMIIDQSTKAREKKIPVFKMQGQPDTYTRSGDPIDEADLPTYFSHFSSTESYMDGVIGGGGGVSSMYFDTSTDTYVVSNKKHSSSNDPQLSDWSSIHSSHENTGYPMYGGRNMRIDDQANNRVADHVDSMFTFEINIEGAPFLDIGDMVELIIPTPENINSSVPHNIFYSGFYLVAGVAHTVNLERSLLTSQLTLVREGCDGKDLEGYTKSRKGKFV